MTRETKIEELGELLDYFLADTADVFILFADLCDSTALKQLLIEQGIPEVFWITRQLLFLQRAAVNIRGYEGIIVKTIGDEVMAIFHATTKPEEVLKCAIGILQGFDNLKLYKDQMKIDAKVSIDFGQTYNGSIIKDVSFDPIGTPVDRCARLNSVTNKREITFSQAFLETLLVDSTDEKLREKYAYQTQK